MKTLIRMVLLMVIAVFLSGCSKITRENFEKIKIGMAMTEVIALIGEPDACSGALGAQKCVWGDPARNITIAFVGGHVVIPAMTGL